MSALADRPDRPPIASPLGTLHLRPERPEDAAFRFALFCEARPDLALLPAALRDGIMQMQLRARDLGHRQQFPQARYDIVALGAEPVGRIAWDQGGGVLHLIDIALIAARRGRGVGTALMRALMAEARAAGCAMRLSVASGNAGAARLYRRLGFATVEERAADAVMEWRAPPG